MKSGSGETIEESSGHSRTLARLYQPITTDIAALKDYLHDEFASSEPFVNELL